MLAAAAAIALLPSMAVGAVPGSLDAGFNPNTNGLIRSIAQQADGKVLIGGSFTCVGVRVPPACPSSNVRNRVARVNADGSLDVGFNPNANSDVRSVAPQADGKIVIGGIFTQVGGVTRRGVARLNANGSVDTAFGDPAIGIDQNTAKGVESVAVQFDGRIVVVGTFTEVGGQNRRYVVRLNADGTVDTTFNPNADGNVFSVALQADGKSLIGGTFVGVGGGDRYRMARLNADGSLDGTFANPKVDTSVFSIAEQPDGKVLIGGIFTCVGESASPSCPSGNVRNNAARLNADGSLDTTFNPDVNGNVRSFTLQADGKIVVGGLFTQVGGQTRNRVARLNADGSLDTAFDPNADDGVWASALQADGKMLIGGIFTEVGGQSRDTVARVLGTTPQVAPDGLGAAAGQEQVTVSWSGVPGEIAAYTATASPGGRSCTTTSTSCTVSGLTNGQAYTFTVTAANTFGSGPASSATAAVTPRVPEQPVAPTQPGGESGQPQAAGGTVTPTPRRLAGSTSVRRGIASTTGTVPTGATRIIQTARSGARSSSLFLDMALQARVRTVTGRCAILRPARKGAARTYRCQMRLAKGTWTVTTTARGRAGVVAQQSRRVVVR